MVPEVPTCQRYHRSGTYNVRGIYRSGNLASEVKQVLLCLAAEPLKCLELGLNSCSAQLSMDACSIQVLEMLGLIGTSEDADISFTHSPLNAQAVAQKLGEGDVP